MRLLFEGGFYYFLRALGAATIQGAASIQINTAFLFLQLSSCHTDRAVEKEVFELEVYCSNKRYGCDWAGKLADYVMVSTLLKLYR